MIKESIIKPKKDDRGYYDPKFSRAGQMEKGVVVTFIKESNDGIKEVRQVSEKMPIVTELVRQEIKSAVKEWYKDKKQDRLSELGINVESIKIFLENLGLESNLDDIVLYKEEDETELNSICENITKYPNTLCKLDDNQAAGYVYNTDLTYIRIKDERFEDITIESEKKLGFESRIIHELLHKSKGVRNVTYSFLKDTQSIIASQSRAGFVTQKLNQDDMSGEFLEEGFVRHIQGMYVKSKRNKETTDKLLKVAQRNRVYNELSSGYLFLKNEYEITNVDPSDYSGATIDLLVNINPDLERYMLEFRKTGSGKNLREIIKIINAIKPGLYKEMKLLQYNEEKIYEWKDLYFKLKSELI